MSSPSDPRPFFRLDGNRRSRWDDIPELAGAPPEWARDVYERAISCAWRRPTMWAASVAGLGAFILPVIACDKVQQALPPRSPWGEAVWVVTFGVILWGFTLVFDAISRPTVRRCVRALLGTHCAGCDYDLRATPDLPPPAVARCPECGRQVPRSVHRRTIPAPRSSAAQRPPGSLGP